MSKYPNAIKNPEEFIAAAHEVINEADAELVQIVRKFGLEDAYRLADELMGDTVNVVKAIAKASSGPTTHLIGRMAAQALARSVAVAMIQDAKAVISDREEGGSDG